MRSSSPPMNRPPSVVASSWYSGFLTKRPTWRGDLPDSISGSTLRWTFDDRLQLEIIIGDATGIEISRRDYHAIYHDPFSPAANPELWTREFFERLHRVLTPGGKLATYSVKGSVRRTLQAVGFEVQKLPGPPGKREMLEAVRQVGMENGE